MQKWFIFVFQRIIPKDVTCFKLFNFQKTLEVQNPGNAARHAPKPGFLLSDYILLSIL